MLQQYCLLQSSIINNTVYCSSAFCGGNFNFEACSTQWTRWHLGGCPTVPLFSIWGAHPHALAVNSGFLANFGFSSFWTEGMKPPFYGWQGSLFWWVGVFHIREADWCHHSSWHRGTYPFHSPLFVWPCQPWPSSVSGCILLGFTICQHQWALTSFPLHLMYVFLLRSMATSPYLRSSPIFCGCSGGCPWQKS